MARFVTGKFALHDQVHRKVAIKTALGFASLLIVGGVSLSGCGGDASANDDYRHPLEMMGEGNIVDLNESGHGCTFEQYQAEDRACTENSSQGSYAVLYQPIPQPGWTFDRWDGACDPDSRYPLCRIELSAEEVRSLANEDRTLPALMAVFVPITKELTEAEAEALEMVRQRMAAFMRCNSEDVAALNNYPHYRLLSEEPWMNVFETHEEYVAFQDIVHALFCNDPVWDRSEWEGLRIVNSDANKVHFTGRFGRYDAEGNKYETTADTFWIATKQDGHWGLKQRSTFLNFDTPGN
jgi:hypothetical protein